MSGFFEGWPNPPDSQSHYRILEKSELIVLAFDLDDKSKLVGFINCLTDHILAAYIPLLEVLPEYRGNGIGRELVERLLDELGPIYMTDLVCDNDMEPFYAKLGFSPKLAMTRRQFDRQSGRND